MILKKTHRDRARDQIVEIAREITRDVASYPGVREAMIVSTARLRVRLAELVAAVAVLDGLPGPQMGQCAREAGKAADSDSPIGQPYASKR